MMDVPELTVAYANISQRVALSYLRSLADLTLVAPEGLAEEQQAELLAAERELHAFFRAFYEALYANPGGFGLPVQADTAIPEDHRIDQRVRQEINQKFKRIRAAINLALDVLMEFGRNGRLAGPALILPQGADEPLAKPLKTLKKFLAGLEQVGVQVERVSDGLALSSTAYPAMAPALQALARAAAQMEDAHLGRFCFARCDFQALRAGYAPEPLTLYRTFNAADYARVVELHRFYTGLGYKALPEIRDVATWLVNYQGNRKIKATPLLQVFFQDHWRQQMMVAIKPASANRIAPIMAHQPESLQRDFFARANRCNAPQCQWCKTRKGLGPSQLEYQGQQKTICWYVNPDVRELDDEMVAVIKAYALMHEELK